MFYLVLYNAKITRETGEKQYEKQYKYSCI